MTVAVKICGLKTEVALDAALDGGADYIGLVFYPKSPRHVDVDAARRLADRARGRTKIVALLVDPDDAVLARIIADVSPDFVQLHGAETPARVEALVSRWNRPVIKAIKVETRNDAEQAEAYVGIVDLILFDAKPPQVATALPGGNGLPFDWSLLDGIKGSLPFMLSGGLSAETVAEAVHMTGASAVDVSSGVEVRPGVKDPALIRRFLHAAKTVRETA